MVLIGMPGIEKRVARFPQFYSRIRFVHEFRPLDEMQVTTLLEQRWVPTGVKLPDEVHAPEVIASLVRMSVGKFPLALKTAHPGRTHPEGQQLPYRHQGNRRCCSRQPRHWPGVTRT